MFSELPMVHKKDLPDLEHSRHNIFRLYFDSSVVYLALEKLRLPFPFSNSLACFLDSS